MQRKINKVPSTIAVAYLRGERTIKKRGVGDKRLLTFEELIKRYGKKDEMQALR